MKMPGAGTQRKLIADGTHGFGLAFKDNALCVRTASEKVNGPESRPGSTAPAANRLGMALKASRGFTLHHRLSFKPNGDLLFSDPGTGLPAGLKVRMLGDHEAEGFGERAMGPADHSVIR